MATVRFSTYPSATEAQIVQAVGSATVTSNIELTVDLGNTMDGGNRQISREEVILSVRRLLDFLVHGGANGTGWPP
jgi:hypothetical protein